MEFCILLPVDNTKLQFSVYLQLRGILFRQTVLSDFMINEKHIYDSQRMMRFVENYETNSTYTNSIKFISAPCIILKNVVIF